MSSPTQSPGLSPTPSAQAHVDVVGDFEGEFDVPCFVFEGAGLQCFGQPTGGGGADVFSINTSDLTPGTRRSGPDLIVTVGPAASELFTSSGDECTVTFERSVDLLQGSFECMGLTVTVVDGGSSETLVVDASGTFSVPR